jgi:hypothetical protein
MTSLRRAVGAVVIALASVPVLSSPAAADPECAPDSDYCAGDDLGTPGSPNEQPAEPAEGQPIGAGPGGSDPGPVCTWEQSGVAGPAGQGDGGPFLVVEGAPSPGAEFYAEVCDGVYTGRVRWVAPGDPTPAAPLPTPEQLASVVRVRLEGSLPAPTVASTPEQGSPALVGYPSFVSVTNWTGVVTDRECDPTGLLCVAVVATPSLRFLPGEPDAPVVECAGPGARFDPAGDPFEQAAAGDACAHPYRLRTGVSGRPAEWPGEVTVAWALAWSSTSGARGSLEPVEKSAAVPRTVNEVQTVVESAGE